MERKLKKEKLRLDAVLGIMECIDCGRRAEEKGDMPFYECRLDVDNCEREYLICEECLYFRVRDGR